MPLPPIPTTVRADCLALRRLLDEQIRRLDKELVARWGDDPRVRRLVTIPGIGPVLAILVVLELADIHRFPSAKHTASYIGLTPRVRASAGSVRVGHISKEGNRLLRWALVVAATQAARRPGPLRTWVSAGAAAEGREDRPRGPRAAARGDHLPGVERRDRLLGGASSRWRAGVSPSYNLGLGPYL